MKPPSDATAALWKQLAEREVAGDLLIVAKREGGLLDYLSGVAGDVSADEVAFDYDGQKLPVKRSKVAAISYYHAQRRSLPEASCRLTLMDGSQIPAHDVALVDDGMLRVKTPAGIELTVSLMHVVRGDFSAGKLAYLSDLKPIEMRWTPRIATPGAASLIADVGQPRNNVSFTGSALSLAWPDESQPTGHEIRTYARGLAIRSRTDLAYRLPSGHAAVHGHCWHRPLHRRPGACRARNSGRRPRPLGRRNRRKAAPRGARPRFGHGAACSSMSTMAETWTMAIACTSWRRA